MFIIQDNWLERTWISLLRQSEQIQKFEFKNLIFRSRWFWRNVRILKLKFKKYITLIKKFSLSKCQNIITVLTIKIIM